MLSYILRLRILKQRQSITGATLVEYALLVALIAVVCIAAIGSFGNSVQRKNYMNVCLMNHGTEEINRQDCESAITGCLDANDASACDYIGNP